MTEYINQDTGERTKWKSLLWKQIGSYLRKKHAIRRDFDDLTQFIEQHQYYMNNLSDNDYYANFGDIQDTKRYIQERKDDIKDRLTNIERIQRNLSERQRKEPQAKAQYERFKDSHSSGSYLLGTRQMPQAQTEDEITEWIDPQTLQVRRRVILAPKTKPASHSILSSPYS